MEVSVKGLAKEKLDFAQREVLRLGGRRADVIKEKACLNEYASLCQAVESFLRQKSKNSLLNLGDQNNSYFHRIVKVKNSKNFNNSSLG